MAGGLSKDHESYKDFKSGFDGRHAPLSAIDKKMLNFAIRSQSNPLIKTHGQILRNFGMYPPEFWMRAQGLASHPDVTPRMRAKLDAIFPDPSRPGPVKGGMPVKTDGKSFSHGVEW